MNRNVLLSDASEESLIAELEVRRVERKRIELNKLINERSPEFYVFNQHSNRWHTFWDLVIVFTDGSEECFTFDSNNGANEQDREKFLHTYFTRLKQVSHEDFYKGRSARKKRKT